MKKYIFIIVFLLSYLTGFSQYIYQGNSSYKNDLIANISNGYIYKGNTQYKSQIICYFDGKYLYKGNSKYKSDIVAIWVNNKIYNGNNTYHENLIAIYRHGKLYYKNTDIVLFTYSNNKVYYRDEIYDSSILLKTSSYVHPIILYYLLL